MPFCGPTLEALQETAELKLLADEPFGVVSRHVQVSVPGGELFTGQEMRPEISLLRGPDPAKKRLEFLHVAALD